MSGADAKERRGEGGCFGCSPPLLFFFFLPWRVSPE